MSIFDFLPDARQRTAFLNRQNQNIADFLNYYLPRNPRDTGSMVDPVVGLIESLSPATDVVESGKSGGELINAIMKGSKLGALRAGSNMLANIGSMAMPGNIVKANEGVLSMMPTKTTGAVDNQPTAKPRYTGVAPDRSDITYLRYKPAKLSERLDASLTALRDPNNPVRKEMIETIMEGSKIGGLDWYNTEELRDWFINALGKDSGDREWRNYLYLMGTTSPGSNVDVNIANASAVRRRMALNENVPGTDKTYMDALLEVKNLNDALKLGKTREKGYGHKTQGLQELASSRYAQGLFGGQPEPGVALTKSSMVQNPKPKGFTNSLLGNRKNIAGDLHFTRFMAMASNHPDWLETTADISSEFKNRIIEAYPKSKKFFTERKVNGKIQPVFAPQKAVKSGIVPLESIKDYPSIWASMPRDNEYGAFEDFMGELGQELNMTPAQVQASLWMGGAKRTGVADESQGTFMELFKRRAQKRADKTGKTVDQVIQEFIKNKGLLALPVTGGLGIGYMKGGLADKEEQEGLMY